MLAEELYRFILLLKRDDLFANSHLGDLLAQGAIGVKEDRVQARSYLEISLMTQSNHVFSLLALAELERAEGKHRADLYARVKQIEPKQPLANARIKGL